MEPSYLYKKKRKSPSGAEATSSKVPCTSPSDGIGEEDEDCRDEEDREDDEDCQDVQDHEDVKYRDNVDEEIESERREANELGSRVANFEKEKAETEEKETDTNNVSGNNEEMKTHVDAGSSVIDVDKKELKSHI